MIPETGNNSVIVKSNRLFPEFQLGYHDFVHQRNILRFYTNMTESLGLFIFNELMIIFL